MSERMKGSSPNHLPLTTGSRLGISHEYMDNWSNQRGTGYTQTGTPNYSDLRYLRSNYIRELYIYMWIQILFSSTPSRCQWLPCINCGQIAIFVSQRPPWNEARLSSCLLHHRPHWRQDPCAGWRAKNLGIWGSWKSLIWVNCNNSLTWILRPFGDDSPY